MKNLTTLLLPLAITGLFACNSGANRNADDSTNAGDTGITQDLAQDVNKDMLQGDSLRGDSKAMTEAAEDGLWEVKVTTDAQTKSTNAGVKKLAKHMQQAHEKANQELMGLAGTKNVILPTAISDTKAKDIADLFEKSGTDFDKAFLEELKDAHERAINLFDKTASNADDPDVKAWFGKTLPELREHLDMIKKEQAKIK
jgi:putative membrane protein